MTYKGHVKNGVVVLDDPVKLPDVVEVRVEILEPKAEPTLADELRSVIGAVKGLPSDLARNHDYYLHGRPKK